MLFGGRSCRRARDQEIGPVEEGLQKEEESLNLHRMKQFQRFAGQADASEMRVLVLAEDTGLVKRRAVHRWQAEAARSQTAAGNPRF